MKELANTNVTVLRASAIRVAMSSLEYVGFIKGCLKRIQMEYAVKVERLNTPILIMKSSVQGKNIYILCMQFKFIIFLKGTLNWYYYILKNWFVNAERPLCNRKLKKNRQMMTNLIKLMRIACQKRIVIIKLRKV